jgi:GDP-L-fucose synthase
MYKKIMVTGGSAVAGTGLKSIIGEYPGCGFFFPTSKECNLLDFGSTKTYVENLKPDAVIHFAAISGGIQLTIDHPASVMRDNVLMNFNIIEAVRICGVPKILMTLSGGMYPMKVEIPIKEESIHEGYPHESNYSYAFAKRLVDPMIKAYRQEYKIDAIGIIPDAILGPRSNFDPKSSTAIPALIRRFYEGREGDSPLVVWGDGSPLRQVTSDQDIARAAIWCLNNYSDTQVLNIGTMEEISIKDAAYAVAEYLKIDSSRIAFDTAKPAGQYRKATDNSRFVGLSGFKYVSILETIKRTIEYFIANYPNPEKLRL